MIAPPARSRPVDTFRGFALAAMIYANYLNPLSTTPEWLRHAPPMEPLRLIDLVFPVFAFVFGLLAPLSLRRHTRNQGRVRTAFHFLRRYFLLILLGVASNGAIGQNPLRHWNVLSSLGLAGLVALPFAPLRRFVRAGIGITLIAAFGVILSNGYARWLLQNERGDLGGVLGATAWAGVMLLASSHAERLEEPNRLVLEALAAGVVFSAAGLALGSLIPLTKPLVTPSYCLLAAGIGSLLLGLFVALDRYFVFGQGVLQTLGANSLAVYIFSSTVSVAWTRFAPPRSFPLALAAASLLLLLSCVLALGLRWRNIYIKL